MQNPLMRQIILCTMLVVLPAFFIAGEVSLLRLRPSRVQRLFEEHKKGAKSLKRLQKRLRRALITSQLSITLAFLALGWTASRINKPSWTDSLISVQTWEIMLFLLIALLATVISGILPKAIVLNQPSAAALKLAPVFETVIQIFSPLLSVLDSITTIIMRLLRLNTKWGELVPALSAGELETLIESGSVTGLRPDERNILEGVFALRDTQVREVMVPRSGMVTLPISIVFSDLMKEVHRTRHARFLVIGDSLDDVKGVLDLRQLAKPISLGAMQADTPLKPYLQPIKRVLETSTLAELIPLFRSGNPLLVVSDEYGGTEGLITAADLTGEIVGDEIEPETNEPDLKQIDTISNQWLATGDLEIIELNRQLKLELPESDDHYTLAGFLLEKLQQVPSVGDLLLFKDITFEVIAMKGPRIDKVKLILPSFDREKN